MVLLVLHSTAEEGSEGPQGQQEQNECGTLQTSQILFVVFRASLFWRSRCGPEQKVRRFRLSHQPGRGIVHRLADASSHDQTAAPVAPPLRRRSPPVYSCRVLLDAIAHRQHVSTWRTQMFVSPHVCPGRRRSTRSPGGGQLLWRNHPAETVSAEWRILLHQNEIKHRPALECRAAPN